MKIITTIHQLNNLEILLQLSDGVIFGNNNYSTRQTNSFTVSEINLIIETAKVQNKSSFLNLNKMYYDHEMDDLRSYLEKIQLKDLTGIIIADIGLINTIDSLGVKDLIVYNPETLLTNHFDFNYLSSDNIKGAFVAKEITLEDIILIGSKKKYNLFYTGHGNLNMFYSKRYLATNFTDHLNNEWQLKNNKNLLIMEKKRVDKKYPLLEDEQGSHVFRSNVLSSLEYIDELSKVVDYLIVDTIFKDDNYAMQILPYYKGNDNITNLSEIQDKIESSYNEEWDSGFLNHKTYYKVRNNREVKNND